MVNKSNSFLKITREKVFSGDFLTMHRKLFFPFAIIFILGLAYSLTMAPGLSWANGGADGGDLITATFVSGVPHPTGYPLYLLIAKIFQKLPFDNLALRTNIFSAFCTILAALLLYQTILCCQKEKNYSRISAVFASLLFGLSPLVWSQAVISEVYGLQSLLTIGIVYQTIRYANRRIDNLLRGLILGLAFGNHITGIFLFPLLFLDGKNLNISKISNIFPRLVGLLAGICVYLILPIHAMSDPPINWFNPVTFDSFIQLVTGSIYQSYFSFDYVMQHSRAWLGFMIENLGFLGVTIGIFALIDNSGKKKIKLLAAWIFLVYGIFSLFYVSYDSYVYLIPTILAFSIWIGLGFESILTYIQGLFHHANWILYPLIIFFFLFRIYTTAPKVNASIDSRAENFGQVVFDTVPEKAMLFTGDDHSTFALWYFHFAEMKRSDTAVIAEGLLVFDWYRQTLRTTYPSLRIPEMLNLTSTHLIIQNPDRPYCFVEYPEKIKIDCNRSKS